MIHELMRGRAAALVAGAMCLLAVLPEAKAAALVAPSNVKASMTLPTNPNAQWFLVEWGDTSTGEDGFEIRARLGRSGKFVVVAHADPNATSWAFALNALKADSLVQFQVLAYTGGSSPAFSEASAPAEVTVPTPKFAAPTGLTATALDGGVIELKWADNSTNEEGFAVELRNEGETAFKWLGNTQFNATTIQVNGFDTPGKIEEFRIRAVRAPTPDPGVSDPAHATAYTNTASAKVKNFFDSAGSASTFWGEPFSYAVTTTHPELRTDLAVTSLPDGLAFDSATAKVTGTPTKVGAFTANMTASFPSLSEQIAGKLQITVKAPAVTSRAFEPATAGSPFSFQIKTSSGNFLTSLAPSGPLPEGLSYDSANATIAGTPTTPGVYVIPVSASFNGFSPAVTSNLTLRIRPPAGPPAEVPGANLALSIPQGGNCTFDLSSLFRDPDAAAAVRLETNLTGNNTIDILLYPDSTPQTVARFFDYVDAGDYDGTIFHRSIPGFIIQGGGYSPAAPPNRFFSVAARPSPVNEPGVSNLRGTVAMAKLPDKPNSATTNFFFNISDNSANLDNQNEGFTVFGRVSASSLAVVDALAAKPTKTFTPVTIDQQTKQTLADCPSNADTAPATIDNTKLLVIKSVRRVPALTYAFASAPSNATLSAALDGENLLLNGQKPGTQDLDLAITDRDGNTITRTLHVTVGAQVTVQGVQGTPFQFESGKPALLYPATTGNETAFRWLKNGKPIASALGAALSVPSIKLQDAGTYQRVATTPSGESTVTLFVGVLEFSSEPASEKAGGQLVLSAKVAGPGFSQVLWTKNGATLADTPGKVAGSATLKLTVSSLAATDSGTYECILLSPDGTRGLAIPRPVGIVTGTPVVKNAFYPTLVVGQLASFSILWDKGTGVAPTKFKIEGLPPGLTLDPETGLVTGRPTAAGYFPLAITGINALGKGTTQTITFFVNPLPAGTKGDFSAYLAPEPNLTEGHGGFLSLSTSSDAKFTGSLVLGLKKYKISGLLETGTGIAPHFALDVPRDGAAPVHIAASLSNGTISGTVDSLPLLTRSLAFSPVSVSQVVANLSPGWDKTAGITPAKFDVKGLPAGMTFDPTTGAISGRPTKPGTYDITIVAINELGSREERTIPLIVNALPAGSTGTFLALIPRDATLNSNLGGLLTLTISDKGTFSGKVVLGTESLPLKGTLDATTNTPPTFSKTVTRKNGTQVEIKDITLNGSLLAASLVANGSNATAISGAQTVTPETALAGIYNSRLSIPAADPNAGVLDAVPQGHGFASLSADAKGSVKITGTLADGTPFLASSSFGYGGRVPLHVVLPSKTDVLLGTANISKNGTENPNLVGAAEWLVTSPSKNVFPATFGPQTLDWIGAKFTPGSVPTMLGLPDQASNASLDFSGANLSGETTNPNILVGIAADNSVTLPATNPAAVTLKIDKAKGTFSGSFRLADVSGPGRKASFQGIIIPGSGGFGSFLLPQPASSLRQPALSGAVEIGK